MEGILLGEFVLIPRDQTKERNIVSSLERELLLRVSPSTGYIPSASDPL